VNAPDEVPVIDERLARAYQLEPWLLQALKELSTSLGIATSPHIVIWDTDIATLFARVDAGGGSWKAVGPTTEWLVRPHSPGESEQHELGRRSGWSYRKTSAMFDESVSGMNGIFEVTWREQRFLLTSGFKHRGWALQDPNFAAVLGPSRDLILLFLKELLLEPWARRTRVRVWGNALEGLTPEPVSEEELILPPDFKQDLLAYLDRFWGLRAKAASLKLPCRRGVLLVGAPGTGKSLFVRHALTRYPEIGAHLFVSSRMHLPGENDLEALLGEVRRAGEPAMIILEDIDHVIESGFMTREFLLNSLDGLLEVDVPVLWLATSNDPSGVERNLLDRPGRFDRIVIFQVPGPSERRQLIRRFSPLGIDEDALREAVARSDSLTGAHLREACSAATLTSLDIDEPYGRALLSELRRMLEHHERARKLRYDMEKEERAGFR
jgi:hypothetical protein